MNARRVAALLREQSKLILELAEAYEEGENEPDASGPSKPRRRRALAYPPPLKEPNELERARARKALRRRGIHT